MNVSERRRWWWWREIILYSWGSEGKCVKWKCVKNEIQHYLHIIWRKEENEENMKCVYYSLWKWEGRGWVTCWRAEVLIWWPGNAEDYKQKQAVAVELMCHMIILKSDIEEDGDPVMIEIVLQIWRIVCCYWRNYSGGRNDQWRKTLKPEDLLKKYEGRNYYSIYISKCVMMVWRMVWKILMIFCNKHLPLWEDYEEWRLWRKCL